MILVGNALHEQQLLHRLSLLQARRAYMEQADEDQCGYIDAQVLPCVQNSC